VITACSAFFIALFRHLHFVGSRACHRTALEFCKLLFALDPNADPLCILLMIDFYAIRAQQHEWMLQLYDHLETEKNLSQLPNWAYSAAMARFLAARELEGDSVATAEAMNKADEALQSALIMFPGILLPLLDKCSIEADKKVAAHVFFVDAQIGYCSIKDRVVFVF
jgi:hypothetical protein